MSRLTSHADLQRAARRDWPRCATPADVQQPLDALMRHYRGLRGEVEPIAACLSMLDGTCLQAVSDAMDSLTPEWRDHAIACVYALLMQHTTRKRLGAYFTPPHLVRHLLRRVATAGVDLAHDRFHDPAAGGAAFLVPIARRKVVAWRRAGVRRPVILTRLARQLTGKEIDPSLAELANALVRAMLQREHGFTRDMVVDFRLVQIGDSLQDVPDAARAGHEIGNPPYRRLLAREHAAACARFGDIVSGRLNLYTMFIRAGLDNVPVGGIVAHVVPASFVGGPEFAGFRRRVLELADVRVLDLIHGRDNVFLDVQQDACFIVLRKRRPDSPRSRKATATAIFRADGSIDDEARVVLPDDGSAWPLSGTSIAGGSTLADLGWRAGVGYLVANRQKALLHSEPGPGRFPLVWAAAITSDGRFSLARGAATKGAGWASSSTGSGIVREPSVVVQRTSSRKQRKRVTAAAVTAAFIAEHGGFIAENHVLVLRRIRVDAVSPEQLAEMLNRPEVSDAMNRACGSACIPAATLAVIRIMGGMGG